MLLVLVNVFTNHWLKIIIMKKSSFTKLILVGLILLFTACKKEIGIQEISTQAEKGYYAVNVESNQVTVRLIGLEGFDDPCFNISFDEVLQGSFRFTGGNIIWNYKDLTTGLHSFSFTCLHECIKENGSEIMKFEIDDGKSQQKVSARKAGHCKFEFWLKVN